MKRRKSRKDAKKWISDTRARIRKQPEVKSERDRRSHTKFIIKIYPHYFQYFEKMKKKAGKTWGKVERWFSKTRVITEEQPKMSGIAYPTLNLR